MIPAFKSLSVACCVAITLSSGNSIETKKEQLWVCYAAVTIGNLHWNILETVGAPKKSQAKKLFYLSIIEDKRFWGKIDSTNGNTFIVRAIIDSEIIRK